MGIGGLSIGSLVLVLAIILLLFGTKRLRNIGSDLGGALSGFRKAVREQEGDVVELEYQAVDPRLETAVIKDRQAC
jgi:sec-independent protein translocase protein TatA